MQHVLFSAALLAVLELLTRAKRGELFNFSIIFKIAKRISPLIFDLVLEPDVATVLLPYAKFGNSGVVSCSPRIIG
jgi:hypothetical protein